MHGGGSTRSRTAEGLKVATYAAQVRLYSGALAEQDCSALRPRQLYRLRKPFKSYFPPWRLGWQEHENSEFAARR
jgi:hypothetical protein